MNGGRKNSIRWIYIGGGIAVLLILVLGTIWMGHSASRDTNEAVRNVSLLYLDELAGRREQVVASNLKENTEKIHVAIELMTEEDLSDIAHLQAYQSRIKRLFDLEKFAFVDTDGLIYTSQGTQTNIDDYHFDYKTLTEPQISILNLETPDKKVVIAVPLEGMSPGGKTQASSLPDAKPQDGMTLEGRKLSVCFSEMDMRVLLEGVSMTSSSTDATFCNIYTRTGVALSNTVLGGLAVEDNLLEALKRADYHEGYSLSQVLSDFAEGRRGEVSFTYDGIQETLSYVPVAGTDWLLTYLIRESVISEQISPTTSRLIGRSLIQSGLTAAVLLALFAFIVSQNRKNARLTLEMETAAAANRVKQQELEEKLALQEQLVERSQALSEALTAAQEANKAKTTFLSNMSHEIRTPMNAIIGLDNIALNDPEISDKTRDYLEKIGNSANHLLALINDILDMSRIESGRMTLKNEKFSFSHLLEQINTIFGGQCQEKGLEYDCEIRGEVDDAYIGDSMKLRQVLINLLGNAVKFTPKGGRVALQVERTGQFDGKSTLQFIVRDTGIGIGEDFLPHLFDAFSQEDGSSTNRYGSSGLGLAITKNIVELMNGNIRVESEKGKGSAFTVTVTLMDAGGRAELPSLEMQPQEMCVLVIDDDPVACEHARLVLEKVGIVSETALSGAQALEMVRLRHARRDPYNLILVDWKMPEMDGVETTRRIRAITGSESAIIILTAYRWDEVHDEAVSAGVDRFISKPLFASSVLEEFRQALQTRRQEGREHTPGKDLRGRRILLAEDIDINAEIITMVLEMREMQVERAANGRIAVEMFAAHPENYYDAVLMDMRMPEMDGLEATRVIRAMDRADARTIPMIALTANAFDEDVQRSLQAGLNAHLSKPVESDALFETLESLLPE